MPIEEAKAIASRLHMDNISYVLRAPVYAHKMAGKDGRLFYGEGMIETRDDLSLIQLPDPYDDALYAEAEAFAAGKGEYAACLVTRIGIFPTFLGMGMENFGVALYEARPFVEEVLTTWRSRARPFSRPGSFASWCSHATNASETRSRSPGSSTAMGT
jgi:hypothetical protein